MTTTTETTPRIYVASLSDYNDGRLHGAWIECEDADTMREDIAAMLAASPINHDPELAWARPVEEYAIHDHDGFRGVRVGEFEDLDTVAEWAEMIDEHGDAWAAYVHDVGDDYATADGFTETFRGECENPADYAQGWYEDCGMLPDHHLAGYVDWERVARDMDESFVSYRGTVYVFLDC